MAKWFGNIGYAIQDETSPGVYEERIITKSHYGEMNRNNRRLTTTDKVNSDITISNELKIIADPFASLNFHLIRYVEYMGSKWTVTNVEVQYPNLIFTLGGIYNAL